MKRSLHVARQGFSLLEVMITLVILSIGLLGVAGLQFRGMESSNDAFYRTQATTLVADMADRIRANPIAARAGAYSTDPLPENDRALADVEDWLAKLETSDGNFVLPAGAGSITCNPCVSVADPFAAAVYTVTVSWDEGRNGTTESFSVTVVP